MSGWPWQSKRFYSGLYYCAYHVFTPVQPTYNVSTLYQRVSLKNYKADLGRFFVLKLVKWCPYVYHQFNTKNQLYNNIFHWRTVSSSADLGRHSFPCSLLQGFPCLPFFNTNKHVGSTWIIICVSIIVFPKIGWMI